ncbi:uncharacterized protein LOC144640229, partial [Oculina patagonica]
LTSTYQPNLLWFDFTVWLSVESVSKTQSLRSILNHFNSTRNVNVDPAAKQRARDFIVKSFKDHGLHTWTEEFPSNQAKYPGVNVVGRLPGRYTGTHDDKIVLIGSHYDSVHTTPGLNDNGSGMTALLQALKLYTSPDKMNCTRNYTLLFVAFDLEEGQPLSSCSGPGNCSCPGSTGSRCGSASFVQNLTQFLNSTRAGFQGAFILETILNHNSTPNSQTLPPVFQQYLQQAYTKISQNQFRGDFLALIGRSRDDGQLISAISNDFKNDITFKTIAIVFPEMFQGRPRNWPWFAFIKKRMRDFFRSDHYRFWDADPSLPAVFITDSANFRGFMQQCYHKDCDDINHVTPEMVTFMGRTTDSVVEVVTNMTNEKCQMKKTECTEQKTADEGEIMTPYYDTQYPNKLDCAWTISVGSDQKDLRLEFTAFDLEESVNCTADYVVIRDGKEKTSPLIGKYCGKTLPEPVNASAQSLYIMFHSDELDTFKGFKAEWSSTYNGTKTTPTFINTIKSAAHGYRPGIVQLIGFFVLTSLTIGL